MFFVPIILLRVYHRMEGGKKFHKLTLHYITAPGSSLGRPILSQMFVEADAMARSLILHTCGNGTN